MKVFKQYHSLSTGNWGNSELPGAMLGNPILQCMIPMFFVTGLRHKKRSLPGENYGRIRQVETTGQGISCETKSSKTLRLCHHQPSGPDLKKI